MLAGVHSFCLSIFNIMHVIIIKCVRSINFVEKKKYILYILIVYRRHNNYYACNNIDNNIVVML